MCAHALQAPLGHHLDAVPRIGVLVVDDNALFRRTILSLLRLYSDIEVIGEASNGNDALRLASTLCPAVVLMDVHLGRAMDGIAATRILKNHCPGMAILGLSWDIREYVVSAMQQAGALEVLAKEQPPDDVHRAIVSAAALRG